MSYMPIVGVWLMVGAPALHPVHHSNQATLTSICPKILKFKFSTHIPLKMWVSYSTWPLCLGFGEFLVPAYTEFSIFHVASRNGPHAQEEENGGSPSEWVIASRVAFPDRQPVSRNVRGDMPKGFTAPCPISHHCNTPSWSHCRVTGGAVSALAPKITTTITLMSPSSSKFHLQPKFLPLLLMPSDGWMGIFSL